MAAVNFTREAALRIAATVRKVERTPTNFTGERAPAHQPGDTFYAYLLSVDVTGKFWSWIKLAPAKELPTLDDPFTLDDVPLFEIEQPPVIGEHTAREINGNKAVPNGAVVELKLFGYDRDGKPVYTFFYQPTQPDPDFLPIHDHRDNVTGGGFAFAVYHPGTGLPQQPWRR